MGKYYQLLEVKMSKEKPNQTLFEKFRESIVVKYFVLPFIIGVIIPIVTTIAKGESITSTIPFLLIISFMTILAIKVFLIQFFYYVSDKFEETRLRDKYLLAEINIIRDKLNILQDTMQEKVKK